MEIQVKLDKVGKMTAKLGEDDTGEQTITLTATAKGSPIALARIAELRRQHCPLYLIVGSPQARFDLRIERVDCLTGETQSEEEIQS